MSFDQLCRALASGNTATVNSAYMAELFRADHDKVLRTIDRLLATKDAQSAAVLSEWFRPSEHADEEDSAHRSFELTREGFMMFVVVWNGNLAKDAKWLCIELFDEMWAAAKEGRKVPDNRLMEGVRKIFAPRAV
jgi:Rha family phage regulatory protein